MVMRSGSFVVSFVAALACSVPFVAQGQTADYPNRPIRLVVPSAPGGSTDGVARVVSHGLNLGLGVPIVVDNRPGAGGLIAAETVARAAPDGYTLYFPFASHTSAPFLQRKMPYDTEKDFAAISQVGVQPLVLVVHPSVPAKTVKELVAFAKSKPGGLNTSFTQIGSATHLATELFKLKTNTVKDILSVGYKGGAASQVALLSGEVQLSIATPTSMLPHIKSGKVNVIAVSGNKRQPYVPDTPTFEESGVPNFNVTSWQGLLAPAGTPPAIINRLHAEVVKLLKLPESLARMAAAGADPVGSTPAEFAAKIRQELVTLRELIKAIGLKPQ